MNKKDSVRDLKQAADQPKWQRITPLSVLGYETAILTYNRCIVNHAHSPLCQSTRVNMQKSNH